MARHVGNGRIVIDVGSFRQRLFHALGPLLSLLFLGAALWVLRRELHHYSFHDIRRQLAMLPPAHLALAGLLTLCSYATLTLYDTLACRYIRNPLPYSRIAFSSFLSFVFSHNVGLSLFGGSAMRYRMLSGWGMSTLDIARVVVFCMATFWLGFFLLGGTVLTLEAHLLPATLGIPAAATRGLGLLLIALLAGYLLWSGSRRSLRFRGLTFEAPRPWLVAGQILVSCVDWTLAAGVLYTLLPATAGLTFPRFVGIFIVTSVAALAAHVPAALGVLETIMVLMLAPYLPADVVLGAVLAYRIVYYLLPLVVGMALLGVHEAVARRRQFVRLEQLFGRWVPQVVPRVLAITIFVGGVILLFSGATPAVHGRMAWLRGLVPLPVVEFSHFLGSVVGMGLLLLARGIQRRVDAAYPLTLALLVTGIVVSLLKGLDYEEAIVLAIMLGALLPSRRYFYRKSSLFDRPFTAEWLTATALAVAGLLFLTLWSHKHAELASSVWWEFTFEGEAPRALRAALGASALLFIVALTRLIRPARGVASRAGDLDLSRAAEVIRSSPDSTAHLALLGDKSLLFNDGGSAFIMYGVEGRSWVAMGDPVGPQEEQQELAWRFRELADLHGGWTVFYEVGPERIPLYLDLGLSLLKLGEAARVPLETFTLDGSARKPLRHTVHRMERERCEFGVIAAAQVPALLGECRAVSDAWLIHKSTREKRFSLGFFDERYLSRTPLAVVRRAGRVIAFANVWAGPVGGELSIDLMRYEAQAPPGVMDFLFIELMLWGRTQGYGHFNLGMAPLAGFEAHPLAPLWSRLGALLFRYGENFYNFEGLRRYKEKFDPEWAPRYLASPGGLALPRVMTHLAALISGGLGGVLSK